ncbi:hypothetical protein BGK67_33770 [Streptomyces subrutilus]|uniref:Uncharacterized protein n=1 Tax=Streptomyces subrutilus TaxID=36818 RepID=A0A1E5P0A4_9ACTN|nr:hypothetical protein BGK67_33770 [Streptomyces subrutilus]
MIFWALGLTGLSQLEHADALRKVFDELKGAGSLFGCGELWKVFDGCDGHFVAGFCCVEPPRVSRFLSVDGLEDLGDPPVYASYLFVPGHTDESVQLVQELIPLGCIAGLPAVPLVSVVPRAGPVGAGRTGIRSVGDPQRGQNPCQEGPRIEPFAG